MKKKILNLIFVSLAALSMGACSDENRNLQQLLDDAAKSGKKNVQLNGTYFVEKPVVLTQAHSGMTINGNGGAKICGAKKVSDLKEVNGVWTGRIEGDTLENLYVNGVRAIPAESDFMYVYSPLKTSVNHEGKKIDSGKDGFVVRGEDVKELLTMTPEELKNVAFDMYIVWFNMHVNLQGFTKNSNGTVNIFAKNPSNLKYYQWERFPRFKIRNIKSVMDKGGEFVFEKNSKTFFYKPRAGENLKTAEVLYPVVKQIFTVKGEENNYAKDITVKGVTFQYGAHMPDAGWHQSPQAQSTVEGFVNVTCAKNFLLQNCVVEHCNLYGVGLGACVEDSKIIENIIFDAGSGGIRVGGMALPGRSLTDSTFGNVIADNIIYQYGRYNKAGVGISIFTSGNNLVEHNTIFDGYYSGMSIGWTWGFAPTNTQNNRVINNRIFKIGHGVLDDMGGIYTIGNATGSVIMGNEISDVRRHRYGGWGIYNDEGSHGYYIANNYVHDTHEDGYFQHYGTNNLIKNNIFENGEVTQIGLGRKNYTDSYFFTRNIVVYSSPAGMFRGNDIIERKTASFDNNIYWNKKGDVSFSGLTLKQWQEKGQDKNSFVIDPALKGTQFGNDNYKKIGFHPFSTKDAGVRKNMKPALEKILKDYKFPALTNCPPEAPWGVDFIEDFSTCKVSKTPSNIGAFTDKKDTDIIVLEENGKKFLRIIDGKNKQDYMPFINLSAKIKSKTVKILFKMRLTADSNFTAEARNNIYKADLPSVVIRNGRLQTPEGLVELPLGKWLSVEFEIELAKDLKRTVKCKIFDGEKLVKSYTAQYKTDPLEAMTVLVVSSAGEKGSYDLTDIKILNVK